MVPNPATLDLGLGLSPRSWRRNRMGGPWRLGWLYQVLCNVYLDPFWASAKPPTVLDCSNSAIEHSIPSLPVRAAQECSRLAHGERRFAGGRTWGCS